MSVLNNPISLDQDVSVNIVDVIDDNIQNNLYHKQDQYQPQLHHQFTASVASSEATEVTTTTAASFSNSYSSLLSIQNTQTNNHNHNTNNKNDKYHTNTNTTIISSKNCWETFINKCTCCTSSLSSQHRQSWSMSNVACALPARPPNLDEIISNKRKSPYTTKEFRTFLSTQHVEEILDFIVEADAYAQQSLVVNSPNELIVSAQHIINTYIVSGSIKQINISEALQKQTINAVANPSDRAQAFVAARREVETLLRNGNYAKQFTSKAQENITVQEQRSRTVNGVLSIMVALILGVLLWILATSSATRWIRLIVFLPSFYGCAYAISGASGV